MFKAFILILFLLLTIMTTGCGSGESNSTEVPQSTLLNGEAFISYIPNDTVAVSDLATIPHNKSSVALLVILLEFNDIAIEQSDSYWSEKIFGYNDTELNDYMQEVSNGAFHFEKATETSGTANDGVIRVQLSQNHFDGDYALMIQALKDAITASDSSINYASYDTNGDGVVQSYELGVIFIAAGYEEAYGGGDTPKVWAHTGGMSSSNVPIADGVKLFDYSHNGRYAIFGERHGDANNYHMAPIGIIAHELGHAIFFLPDLYNTTPSDSTGGIGVFGLMGSGSWTRKAINEVYGDTPTHLCAWSKSYIGWVTPVEQNNTIASLYESSSSSFNVIKIPISANHYYLIENRNKNGYDRGFYGAFFDNYVGGLAIWHINQNKLTISNFEDNNVNADTSDKGVDLVEAVDPVLDTLGGAGNAKAFFYHDNRATFGEKITNISNPASVMDITIH